MSTESEPRKVHLKLSPQAQRYARRDAPRDARLMAARGALPLPPIELATVLFVLMHDPDPEVKSLARDSLEGLPDTVVAPVLEGDVNAAVLSHLAHAFCEDEERLQKIALNPATDDRTLAYLAAQPFRAVVDIVSNNQERMLRCPEIVDALGSNPLTGRAVIERILTFLGMDVPAGDDAEQDDEPSGDIDDDEAIAALQAVLGDGFGDLSLLVEEGEEGDEDLIDAEKSANMYALIQKMSVFQKIRLGRLGNKEARNLLIRDRNKVVAVAALTSPKMTENEIGSIAKLRNVHDEVLRIIARKREWTRSYHVKLALATNPKCPQATAVQFINYLQDRDLRQIMRSKDVPAAVATHARRALMRKGKI